MQGTRKKGAMMITQHRQLNICITLLSTWRPEWKFGHLYVVNSCECCLISQTVHVYWHCKATCLTHSDLHNHYPTTHTVFILIQKTRVVFKGCKQYSYTQCNTIDSSDFINGKTALCTHLFGLQQSVHTQWQSSSELNEIHTQVFFVLLWKARQNMSQRCL